MSDHQTELWSDSAHAWITRIEKGDINRTHLLDPVLLERAGDLAGLKACDVGCGEGRFCRLLAERGALVTGIDPIPSFIERARTLDPEGRYVEGGGESLPFADGEFDLVICYLVLIDIDDYRSAISEMARITRRGGRILIANINPFYTATNEKWRYDEETGVMMLPVSEYFRERGTRVRWDSIDVINYHRPYRDYFEAFLSHPLRLTFFEEPRPTDEAVAAHRSLALGRNAPYFQIMEWRKD